MVLKEIKKPEVIGGLKIMAADLFKAPVESMKKDPAAVKVIESPIEP